MLKGKEIIEMLQGKEDFEFGLNIKFLGRSIALSDGEIYVDLIEEYKKGYLTMDTKGLNYGFTFDDGKPKIKKQKIKKV